jgi:hypothetical protein
MQILERQVAETGSGIEQDIVVDEHCGGTGACTDSTAAAQYSYSHTIAASRRYAGTRVLMNSTIWDDCSAKN